jgi:hypothetical protein
MLSFGRACARSPADPPWPHSATKAVAGNMEVLFVPLNIALST